MTRDDSGAAKHHFKKRAEEYNEHDAWDSTREGYFLIRCPGCETPMHLGEGWRGCPIPECPDCNETADEWTDDPRITEERASELTADSQNLAELITP